MLAALLAVMSKEIRQTVRDKRMVAMLLVVPVIHALLRRTAPRDDSEEAFDREGRTA